MTLNHTVCCPNLTLRRYPRLSPLVTSEIQVVTKSHWFLPSEYLWRPCTSFFVPYHSASLGHPGILCLSGTSQHLSYQDTMVFSLPRTASALPSVLSPTRLFVHCGTVTRTVQLEHRFWGRRKNSERRLEVYAGPDPTWHFRHVQGFEFPPETNGMPMKD